MRWIWLLIGIILFILGVMFALLNPNSIELNLFVFQFKTTLALALLCFFAIGGILGLLIGFINGRLNTKKQNRHKADKPIKVFQ